MVATTVTITDMKYYDVSATYPTAVSSEEAGYGDAGTQGSALTLYLYDISYNVEAHVTDDASVGKKKSDTATKRFENPEVDTMGVHIPKWTLRFIFDANDSTHLIKYGRLMHMIKTKGYKKITLSNITHAPIISYGKYGQQVADGATATVTILNGRIKSFSIKQVEKQGRKIDVTMDFWETT